MSKYEKHIRQLQLERELITGKICICKSHNHIMANTITCLKEESKTPYKINYYNK